MTLLDYLKQYVKVMNLDDGSILHETGDDDNLFFTNLMGLNDGCKEAQDAYKEEISNLDEIINDENLFLRDIVYAAWLTHNEYDLDFEIGEDEMEYMYEDEHNYEIHIGNDYKVEYKEEIDLT